MPFDPGKSKGNYDNFHGYSNPYAPPQPIQHKKSNAKLFVGLFVGVLMLFFVCIGIFIFFNAKDNTSNQNNVNTSVEQYVDVEIYDVKEEE